MWRRVSDLYWFVWLIETIVGRHLVVTSFGNAPGLSGWWHRRGKCLWWGDQGDRRPGKQAGASRRWCRV